jgi:outer membrane protein OmpA-like peptidoglycan-associated protein
MVLTLSTVRDYGSNSLIIYYSSEKAAFGNEPKARNMHKFFLYTVYIFESFFEIWASWVGIMMRCLRRLLVVICLVLIGAVSGLVALVTPTQAAEFKAADDIIKSLAPIEYLPKHGGNLKRAVDLEVNFLVNSAKLTKQARKQLDQLAKALATKTLKQSRFAIVGHTDTSSPANYNLKLSKKRAAVVVTYLVRSHRIVRKRLKADGKGESELKDPVPGAAVNRRVEVINLNPVIPLPKRDPGKEIRDILTQ